MPTKTQAKTQAPARAAQARAAETARRLCDTFGLEDPTILTAALVEAAADELRHNPRLAGRVRAIYEELAHPQPASASRPGAPRPEPQLIPLVPVLETDLDLSGPLDPYLLYRVYGGAQLWAALERYPLATLKEAAAREHDRHPDTRPANKTQKAALIAYLVERVAGVDHPN
ncbi:MAG: hypothetical protein IVW57_12690 [Ktedonobacterales bacterium]|nr:hypothetical protein [Ktedonobacterales bacterium]